MDFESEDESDGARTNDEACAGVRPEDHDVSESDGCIATSLVRYSRKRLMRSLSLSLCVSGRSPV